MNYLGRYVLGAGAVLLSLVVAACSKKDQAATADASSSSASSASIESTDASAMTADPPRERTPKELLDDYRGTLAEFAAQEKYAEICKGAPWINQVICNWTAARASGKAVERPDGELFRAYFAKERWKHVYGTIVSDPAESGDYIEVSVGGYRNHCVLSTIDTKFSTRGRFDMWVQEQPKTHEVTLNSGATANWVELEEAPLAKTLMGLAKSGGGIEATAMAKDAMKMIAQYETYAERKGEIPPVPGTTPTLAAPGADPSTATASATAVVQPRTTATPVVQKAASPSVKATTETPPPAVPATPTTGPTTTGGGGVPFDRGAAASALGAVSVQSCKRPGGPTGSGHVKVTFAPDGSASAATVDDPFAGTDVGTCVEGKYRSARVPAFAGTPTNVRKSFTID